ncbi:Crp/Fnr family transcriptional regulator [Paenibacillus sp. FSL M7-1455]|jgi:CRP/FNR family transcriptional regulator|uniref:Anaerobic regulatory protein n=1 Tax=Paenibacillus cookii TaxID=157839 RepID=A0ABQ4LRH4_9BACL|nr:Crp/Fnr family transcriptional regulator [Paenibacillus cookii]KHF36792.1 Anaerobic regulatory protein [Paenibacillus sp. P1XP2]GIO65386.1 anaerobic regulatory protein [Paenibacillus cookii]
MSNQLNVIETRGNASCFSEQNLDRLMAVMHDRTVPEGSHLFWEGDSSDKLYYVKSGRVQLTKSTDEGKELILYMYQAGDIVGHADPFFSHKQTYTAEVMEESVVGVIDHKDLESLICQHCDFALDFMKWMGIHHRLTQTKFRDLMMYGKPGALCSTLIRLSNTYGEERGDGILINKKITHTDLSNMIGSTRESVNRLLGDLRKKNAIEYENGLIVIKDLEMLQDICHCELCPKEICRI